MIGIGIKSSDLDIVDLPASEDLKNLRQDLVIKENMEMVAEFICNICKNIVYDAVSCQKCQNLFCKICLDNFLKVEKTCPLKCGILAYQPISKSSKNLINKIKLKCPRSDLGCKETVQYENLLAHLKNCSVKKYKCEFCEFKGKFEDCVQHAKKCQYSFNTCQDCLELIKKKRISLHTLKMCSENICK